MSTNELAGTEINSPISLLTRQDCQERLLKAIQRLDDLEARLIHVQNNAAFP